MDNKIKTQAHHAQIKDAVEESWQELETVAGSSSLREASRLSLPQINGLVTRMSRLVPSSSAPGLILHGLTRLKGQTLSPERVRRDTRLLFESMEKALVYGTFFAGPASVLWAYQSLLKLVGRQPEDAFPEGTWQFYVDYALREDTARHTVETHGFDTLFDKHAINLEFVDRMTAWGMAAIHCLHGYDEWLRNEWRERVYISLLQALTQDDAKRFQNLYRRWQRQRPYQRGADAKSYESYADYRRKKFDQFIEKNMRHLPTSVRREWVKRVWQAQRTDLINYQKQMSILAYLEPNRYGEVRRPIPLARAQIGIIYEGQYYLLPACQPGSDLPANVNTVRTQMSLILQNRTHGSPVRLMETTRLARNSWPTLLPQLNTTLTNHLQRLSMAPILINFDERPFHLPLSEIRQAERGIGDHAITIFDTRKSFVFDLSHIFFDGTWGAALAEILTNEAAAWANYLYNSDVRDESLGLETGPLKATDALSSLATMHLKLPLKRDDWTAIERYPRISAEAYAETTQVSMQQLQTLRVLCKQNRPVLKLTVNDVLVLYRVIHALTYELNDALHAVLETLANDERAHDAAQSALAVLESSKQHPAILIPVDASRRAPRQRIYPLTMDVPMAVPELQTLHQQTWQAWQAWQRGDPQAAQTYAHFRRDYLTTLVILGEIFDRMKKTAASGDSNSVGTIKLLAHLPRRMQHLLDKIPDHFDLLNDIIKGREVFSNVGVVVPGSTLTRFMTAKDDNEQKTLAWGVLTDADSVMHVTLRDFRPHVTQLIAAGYHDLANRLAQDYLDSWVDGLNQFVSELVQIMKVSEVLRE